MTQVKGQITLNDILSEDVPLEYTDDSHKGNMIPFQKLSEYIGKRVLIEMPRQSAIDYKVVIIKSYYKDADRSYRLNKNSGEYEVEHTYDKVGFSDDRKKQHKENMWVGEIYCSNGRFKPAFPYPECFYEYRVI